MKDYDVFISYARKDKDKLVDELHEQFKKLNVKIFYDAESLEWGDDWKSKISKTINSCKYGVVIISNNYFGREWTEKELNELLRQKNASYQ